MDLDNYNRNSAEGLHTTSIAAAWMNIVYGFGGVRSEGEILACAPSLPEEWRAYEFRILYRNVHIKIRVSREILSFTTTDRIETPVPLLIYGKHCNLDSRGISLPLETGTNICTA
jgi:maltose phosphorylase